jgi:hypothetical protein
MAAKPFEIRTFIELVRFSNGSTKLDCFIKKKIVFFVTILFIKWSSLVIFGTEPPF